MYARPVSHRSTPNAAGGKLAAPSTGGKAKKGATPAKGKGASSSTAAADMESNGAGGSSSAGASSTAAAGNRSTATGNPVAPQSSAAAGSSSSAAAGTAPRSSTRSRGRGTSVAAWLDEDDDYDDDFTAYDDGCYGSSSGSIPGNRRGGSGSRSRARPERPAGMVKPLRQVPKNSPACSIAAGPVVTPMGKSPGGGGFMVGSAGASSIGILGTSPGCGSTPGSGRRARRNARRAAIDAESYGGSPDWE